MYIYLVFALAVIFVAYVAERHSNFISSALDVGHPHQFYYYSSAPLYRDVSSDFTLCAAAVSRYHQIVEILASWPFTRTYIKERDQHDSCWSN